MRSILSEKVHEKNGLAKCLIGDTDENISIITKLFSHGADKLSISNANYRVRLWVAMQNKIHVYDPYMEEKKWEECLESEVTTMTYHPHSEEMFIALENATVAVFSAFVHQTTLSLPDCFF